jgi:hypothetical protein
VLTVLDTPISATLAFTLACFPVFALKQLISVVQLVTACQKIVQHDEAAILIAKTKAQ